MKNKIWYYGLPVLGVLFGLWYVKQAFVDVVYSDYIRLVNSYLPDVWNPRKFFVGDILTRIPLNYGARIINVIFFDYRIRFDQVLGVISLGLSAVLLASYAIKKNIGALWFLCLMAVMFSLNKWEMMINGSGWIHFFAFAGFYYHYLVLERVWTGCQKKGDHRRLLLLPWVLTLAVAGPYCAVYTAVLWLTYGLKAGMVWMKEKRWNKDYLAYAVSSAVPLLLYIWSNSCVIDEPKGIAEVSFTEQLLSTPGYFLRFFIKSFASMAVGVECAEAAFHTNLPYLALGLMVIGSYGAAVVLYIRCRLYEKTVFPLILMGAGILNHVLILLSRWVYLNENYGMSSRYALQFQTGILGIILTFALAGRGMKKGKAGFRGRAAVRAVTVAVTAVILGGNIYTTREELRKAPARAEYCARRAEIALDFENRTDDELRENFEYRTGNPQSGQAVREALTILKENHLNIFR